MTTLAPVRPTATPVDDTRPPGRVSDLNRLRIPVAVALITGVVGHFVTIGADARWLAALGHVIVARGAIPRGIPFAAAPTGHWANTLVLAELIFNALGARGLLFAEIVAVAAAMSLLARDARAGGAPAQRIGPVLALVAVGAFTSLAIARVQLFSLVLFPLLVLLLRVEHRRPSNRIWLALPLLALWSNLHGAALSGLLVLWGYLLLSRVRARDERIRSVVVGALAPVALCLTPAGVRSVDYYHGLLTNVAAQRGAGQWAPLGLSAVDLLLIGVGLLLAVRAVRARPPLWELAVALVLAALTVKAARDGVWLLMFLAPVAAWGPRPRRDWRGLLPLGALLAAALLVLDVVQAPDAGGAPPSAVARAIRFAHGTPILADAIGAEQVADAGGRIWAGNPIDAFSHTVQSEYVDWVDGQAGGRAALAIPSVHVVLVTAGSAAAALTERDPRFRLVRRDGDADLFTRAGARRG